LPKTKIIATLGPASSSQTVLRKMFIHGLDLVRLNFSHGSLQDHEKRIGQVRALNQKMKRAVKIMGDLEGFRIRVGKLRNPLVLKKDTVVYLTQEEIMGEGRMIPFDYKGSLDRFLKNDLIYIDDGRIVLHVVGIDQTRLKVRIAVGGELKDYKGINFPDVKLEFGSLTEKDRKDIEFVIRHQLDYLAQSFVRSGSDMIKIRELVKPELESCRLIAKIENREALEHLDEILDVSDGIMIARGDLGISVPIYKVPMIQKEIIRKCREKRKPVIVATQMLESMTRELIPTRAEVTDVANAILDGATHCMLSAETAVGDHPEKVVAMMNQIITYTENYSG